MADFEDGFNDANATLLQSHTPDVGLSWTWNGTNSGGFLIQSNFLQATAAPTPGVGSCTILLAGSTELSSADRMHWHRLKRLSTANTSHYVALRYVDDNNFFGWKLGGTGSAGLRFIKIVASTETNVITGQGVDEEWYRTKIVGSAASLWSGGTGAEPSSPTEDSSWTSMGTGTITDFPSELTAGLVNLGSPSGTEWMDDLRFHAIASAAHVIPVSGGLAMSGAVAFRKTRKIPAAGGVAMAGAAPMSKTHLMAPAGGLVVGGEANFNKVHLIAPTGGLAMGGSAPFTTHDALHVITPSGGITLSGAAALEFTGEQSSFIHSVIRAVPKTTVYPTHRDDPSDGDWRD